MDQTTGPTLHRMFPNSGPAPPYRRLGSGPTRSSTSTGSARKPAVVQGRGRRTAQAAGAATRYASWSGSSPMSSRRGTRQILSVGRLGTNWGLATALYAREQGIDTALALIDQPMDEHVHAQLDRLGASGAPALHPDEGADDRGGALAVRCGTRAAGACPTSCRRADPRRSGPSVTSRPPWSSRRQVEAARCRSRRMW